MGRNRAVGKAEHKRQAEEVLRAETYRQGRAWIFRGVWALLVAIGLAFLAPFMAGLLAVIGLACIGQGARVAMRVPLPPKASG